MKLFVHSSLRRCGAFSLVEIAITVTVIGLLATIGTAVTGDVVSASRLQKLESDTVILNSAVQSYIASGGSVDGVVSVDDLIARLKVKTANPMSARIPGLSSSMVDPRVTTVMQSAAESETTDPRVVWDTASKRLIVMTSGGVGVKKFRLDDELAEVEGSTGDRATAMKYSGESTWIWDYQDVALPAAPAGPDSFPVTPDVPLGLLTAAPPVPVLFPIAKLTLEPPIASLAGGTYLRDGFDLTVSLNNPNPPGVSEVYYSVNFGNWIRYAAPLLVGPSAVLSAQAIPVVPEWEESGKVDHTYSVTPEILLAPDVLPDKPNFGNTLGGEVTVTLNDTNRSGLAVLLYRVDAGAWSVYSGPFVLNSGSYPGGATVEAKAVATAPYFLDSGVAGASIGVVAPGSGGTGGMALVKEAMTLDGQVIGGIRNLNASSVTINGSTRVTGDIALSGTPTVTINGSVDFGGIVEAGGPSTPSGYLVILNSGAQFGKLITRSQLVPFPTLNHPPSTSGPWISVDSPSGIPSSWFPNSGVNLNSNARSIQLPPGTYGMFTASNVNSGGEVVLGNSNGTPAVYNFQSFTLNSGVPVRIVGPVTINTREFTINAGSRVGNAGTKDKLTINVSGNQFIDNSAGTLYAKTILVPNGTTYINGKVHATVTTKNLTVNSTGILNLIE